jgi:hypothetical protein
MALPRAVLVDIDGTLALRGTEPGARKFYHWHRVGEDLPNPAVVELVQTLASAGRHAIVVMSGRDAVCRPQTERWLRRHKVPFDELWMRPHKDNRPDTVVKRELYERQVAGRYEVAFVVDDRDSVVRMWRQELGLTVLQCAYGDF